jgi:hypothetical protein
MGNGAVENGAKNKQGFKDFLGGVKDGLSTVLNFGQDVLATPGVKDAINMGAAAFGVPVPVGDMISSGVGIASNLVGGGRGGKQKRDIFKDPIFKDPNKYDFKSGYDQISSLIKRKQGPVYKK